MGRRLSRAAFVPLDVIKGADRLRAHLPIAGSLSVIGQLDYGVLARPAQTPFLLRHYPKAVAGKPDELNRLRPRAETRLEIMSQFASDQRGADCAARRKTSRRRKDSILST